MKASVFLDLETTGIKPDINEIIEVAAIRFDGSDTKIFQSLIKPRSQVPYYITRLTGISLSELQKAPSFHQIRAELTEFVDDSILIGHNFSFDLGFLEAAGLKLDNPVYDTLELARLLLPSLPEYSLLSLSTFLGTEHLPKHRALDDAMATRLVFQRLKNKAASLSKADLEGILRFLPLTGWGFIKFFEEAYTARAWNIEEDRIKKKKEFQARTKKNETANRERQPLTRLDFKKINSLFKAGSPLSKSFSSFESRPGQIQMAHSVNEAFLQKKNLLAEVGTGTGKSLAYLLSSLYLASSEKRPVVISTNTINLQEQLINKDIPGLRQVPGLGALNVQQMKGRNNYLCMRRWKNLFSDRNLTQEEARLALRIFLWIKECKNGDRGEIQLKGEEETVWKKICSTESDCLEGQCPHRKAGNCFFHEARDRAEKASLLIINHALLISDLATGNNVLPDYDYLVVDEAHHLEDVATEHLGFRLKEKDLQEFLEEAKRALYTYSREESDDKKISSKDANKILKQEIKTQSGLISVHIAGLKKEVSLFYVKCKEFVQSATRDPEEYEQKVRLVPKSRSLPGWHGIIKCSEQLLKSLESLEKELEKLSLKLEALPENIRGESCKALPGIIKQSQEIRGQISSLVLSPDEELIYWCAVTLGEAVLCAAPLCVGSVLDKQLFSEKSSVVLTSATLCPGGDFNFIQKRLGLTEADKISILSPFDYSGSCLVTIAGDMPEPDKKNYKESLEEALKTLCRATKGKTLVLFTAHNILRSLRYSLQPVLDGEGILLLAQGVDGSAKHLLEQFRSQENTILFGTSSFWEGVDVVGEALSVLVIVKLPFPVPSDPIIEARSQEYGEPFREYSLPQAILKFKQGFGRLIRSQSDRGVMVVLDSRIKNKYYGKNFLEALPLCPVKFTATRDISKEVRSWLGWN